jgi:predicted RNA binding protein YcfA (HicA-like mRNA interferase family)
MTTYQAINVIVKSIDFIYAKDMPKKVRELSVLLKAGFEVARTRGSHERWIHPLLPEFPITVAGKDGDDAKLYLEKLVKQALQALKAKE